jgi:hypothetical protein
VLKTNKRFKKHSVILVPLEVSDGQNHNVTIGTAKFSSHPLGVTRCQRNAVVNHREGARTNTEIVCELPSGCVGDGDRVRRSADCPTQRDPSAQRPRNGQPSVHGHHVRNGEDSGSGGPVHSHRELVAVDDVYVVLPEELQQATHTRRIDGTFEPKSLWRRTGASEKVSQPADAIPGQHWNDSATAAPKLLG